MYLTLVILLVAGLAVGMLSGLLGIGGGTVIVPLLRLGVGLDAITAVGTSLFTIIPTSLAGMVTHLRNGTAHAGLGVLFGASGALFAVLGSMASKAVPSAVVMATAAVVIIYTAVRMLYRAFKAKRKVAAAPVEVASTCGTGSEGGATVDGATYKPASAHHVHFTPRTVVLGICVGAVAGSLSGFIGVGGGFIMVPLAVLIFGIPMVEAAGTSLVAIIILAIPGAITHALAGDVAYLQGIALAVGAIPGAVFGGMLSKRVPDRALKGIFGIVLIVVGVMLALNEFVIR